MIQRFLPKQLVLTITMVDMKSAVPGSTTACVYANAIRRLLKGKATWVSVRPNRITITCYGMVHHFSVPTKVVHDQVLNDVGELNLSLIGRTVTIKQTDKPTPAQEPKVQQARQPAINAARTTRAAKGKPDKKYENPRQLLAKAARILAKQNINLRQAA